MLYNYLKIALRNLIRNKVSSFINIGGLAAGMAVTMLIGLWIYDELSFNKYHQNYDRIAQVMRHFTIEGKKETGGQSNPLPLSTELRSSFGSDFTYVVLATKPVDYIISVGEKKFTQTGRFMQPQAPQMLTLRMRQGSHAGLQEQNTILLSETLAEKLFGDADPINRIVTIDNKVKAKVTGVYEDLPHNSEFKEASYIAPFDLYVSFNSWVKEVQDNWWDNSFPIYVQIAPHTTFDQVPQKIKSVMLPHMDAERAALKPEVFLHPMRKWHLYSQFENGVNSTSEALQFVWLYGLIGAFILLLACVNFMNLSTARSQKRAKEVGIRKTVGSVRSQLISQFLSETLVIAAFAFVLCLLLVQLALPWFEKVAAKEITVLWLNPTFWVLSTSFMVVTALLAGSYPAMYLSSLEPVKVLKGAIVGTPQGAILRKVLVVFQFTISITLIVGTGIVYKQIVFFKNKPVGFERAGLLTFPINGWREKAKVLRSELLRTGAVYEVAESASKLTSVGSNNTGFEWQGKVPGADDDFGTLGVSYEYGKAIGWQFVAGRDFSREFTSDSSGLVVNEAAVKLMGLKNPVGEVIRSLDWHQGNFKILGVVKDMVMESPFEPARPTIFALQGSKNWLFVKINPQVSAREALPKIEAVFKQVIPTVPFDYKFVDEEYAAKFKAEERVGTLAGGFASLAIIISCLGLFGLASFTAEQRTKEIGIRKVLGASVFSVVGLLSKDFLKLVLLANLLAWPLAYWGMHNWLQNYSFRIPVSAWLFVVPALLVLAIALLTVSFQAIKAAVANPVNSLRNE